MILCIDADNLQVTRCGSSITVLARHPTPLHHATRIGTAASTTSVTMNLLHTVRCSLTGEVMTLHHTGIAATLTGADHINSRNNHMRLGLVFQS